MKKGQISLEFLFIFVLFMVLLTFSIRNITFSSEQS
ncbi:MAG: class III signal peptide-containing protein, partial [Thermococcus sp.]|nr:class III signal peptide-containing protein [Thermococcus sp.]